MLHPECSKKKKRKKERKETKPGFILTSLVIPNVIMLLPALGSSEHKNTEEKKKITKKGKQSIAGLGQ